MVAQAGKVMVDWSLQGRFNVWQSQSSKYLGIGSLEHLPDAGRHRQLLSSLQVCNGIVYCKWEEKIGLVFTSVIRGLEVLYQAFLLLFQWTAPQHLDNETTLMIKDSILSSSDVRRTCSLWVLLLSRFLVRCSGECWGVRAVNVSGVYKPWRVWACLRFEKGGERCKVNNGSFDTRLCHEEWVGQEKERSYQEAGGVQG